MLINVTVKRLSCRFQNCQLGISVSSAYSFIFLCLHFVLQDAFSTIFLQQQEFDWVLCKIDLLSVVLLSVIHTLLQFNLWKFPLPQFAKVWGTEWNSHVQMRSLYGKQRHGLFPSSVISHNVGIACACHSRTTGSLYNVAMLLGKLKRLAQIHARTLNMV